MLRDYADFINVVNKNTCFKMLNWKRIEYIFNGLKVIFGFKIFRNILHLFINSF